MTPNHRLQTFSSYPPTQQAKPSAVISHRVGQREVPLTLLGLVAALGFFCGLIVSSQQQAFDFEPVDFTRSRRTDPATSQSAEASVAPKLNRIMVEILAVADDTPRTARELAELAAMGRRNQGIKVPEIETYRKRARELQVISELEECEPKICSHTGTSATTYIKPPR